MSCDAAPRRIRSATIASTAPSPIIFAREFATKYVSDDRNQKNPPAVVGTKPKSAAEKYFLRRS
jgi:hypothetical protein